MKIEIQTYNPKWLDDFNKEKSILKSVVKDSLVEHIGSTSVYSLSSKPVIDIMIGVHDFSSVNSLVPKIEGLSYQYVSKYEETMPDRRFFIKEHDGKRTHHIHMVVFGESFWQRHIKFRDVLRNNEPVRLLYEKLKLELSKKEWGSGDDYARAKSDFIEKILKEN